MKNRIYFVELEANCKEREKSDCEAPRIVTPRREYPAPSAYCMPLVNALLTCWLLVEIKWNRDVDNFAKDKYFLLKRSFSFSSAYENLKLINWIRDFAEGKK